MKKMTEKRSLLARLRDDRRGNFAMMTALIAVPFCLAAGVAVDFSMAERGRSNLQDAADSAALAGGSIFDGTNLAAAKEEAQKLLRANLGSNYDEVTIDISGESRTLHVALTQAVPTSIMKIASIDSVNIGVQAAATSPVKPTTIKFTPEKAQGWYYKKISILVTRPGSSTEEVVGTVEYKPTTRTDGGQGTMTVEPDGVINLGIYDKLILQMDIKNDSCPLGSYFNSNNNTVKCKLSSDNKYKKYDRVLRSDDTSTSHYLFVDGIQLPQGVVQPLQTFFGCGKPQKHAWEDGGGFDRQDFFYSVSSNCITPDGEYVRLVK